MLTQIVYGVSVKCYFPDNTNPLQILRQHYYHSKDLYHYRFAFVVVLGRHTIPKKLHSSFILPISLTGGRGRDPSGVDTEDGWRPSWFPGSTDSGKPLLVS